MDYGDTVSRSQARKKTAAPGITMGEENQAQAGTEEGLNKQEKGWRQLETGETC